MYVETGTKIYSIADLSKLWVLLEAYESDLPWLRIGQQLSFTSTSFPGETFVASISFIDPVVDPNTRTVRVRAEVDNDKLRLKPQMFVSGVVASRVDGEGNVAKQTGSKTGAPLLLPATAPLITGRRAVVYVDISNADGPLFEGREVDLGPRAGDFYIVKSGLDEGELVVTNGAFKIDSELQIRAKPSMMSPEGGGAPPGHDHGTGNGGAPGAPAREPYAQAATSARLDESEDVLRSLAPVYEAYFGVQMALAADDHDGAVSAALEIEEAVGKVDMAVFSHAGHKRWMDLSGSMSAQAQKMGRSGDIVAARESFYFLSIAAIELHDSFGHSGDGDFYLTFCPMARDNAGAFWLQAENIVWNSFFGASMLRCGEIKESFPPVTAGVE
jgi:Cu(I)/Ag(I) efflux system membrane fusion protein